MEADGNCAPLQNVKKFIFNTGVSDSRLIFKTFDSQEAGIKICGSSKKKRKNSTFEPERLRISDAKKRVLLILIRDGIMPSKYHR